MSAGRIKVYLNTEQLERPMDARVMEAVTETNPRIQDTYDRREEENLGDAAVGILEELEDFLGPRHLLGLVTDDDHREVKEMLDRIASEELGYDPGDLLEYEFV